VHPNERKKLLSPAPRVATRTPAGCSAKRTAHTGAPQRAAPGQQEPVDARRSLHAAARGRGPPGDVWRASALGGGITVILCNLVLAGRTPGPEWQPGGRRLEACRQGFARCRRFREIQANTREYRRVPLQRSNNARHRHRGAHLSAVSRTPARSNPCFRV
jgi:hypothetical protein